MQQMFIHPERGVVSVKRGFSWPSFWFGSLWAMAHHMWVPWVIALVPIELLVWFLTGVAQAREDDAMGALVLLAAVVLALVRGRYGNRWLAAALRRRGYAERDA